MNSMEKASTVSLALLYSFRMLGLFMVLPVLSLYMASTDSDQAIAGATPLLIGLAIGGYGLTQALMQIPFGALSDRFGRKSLITIGYLFFIAGSLIAACSDDIYGIIAGRLLQGFGAVAACIMALLGDLTSEEVRTRSMAMVGASIGLSFAVSIVLGPIVDSIWGLQGIFWLTALLGVIGLGILWLLVPNPPKALYSLETLSTSGGLIKSWKNLELQRVYWGVLILHALLTAVFIILPARILEVFDITAASSGWVYLPVVIVGFFLAVPFILVAEVKRKMKAMLVMAVALLSLSVISLVIETQSAVFLIILLCVFFLAFNLLEATLPSLVAKLASAGTRGSAMGLFSSHQFFGAFLGGWFGGAALQHGGSDFLIYLCFAALIIWLFMVVTMKPPKFLKSTSIALSDYEAYEHAASSLADCQGVLEVFWYQDKCTLYVKYDPDVTNDGLIQTVALGHEPEATV